MAEDFIPKSTVNYINKAKKDITKSLVGSLVKKYANEIDDGIKAGLSSKQIAENLRKKDSSIKSKTIANTLARTALHASYSMGAITDMLDDETIVAFRFNAVNDSRTSDICERLDGKIISKDEVLRFLPPLHYNCRSVLEPIFFNEKIPADKLIDKNTYKTKDYQEKIEPLMKKQEAFLKYQKEDIEQVLNETQQVIKEPEVPKVDKRVEEVKYLISKKINTPDDAINIGKKIDDIIKDNIKADVNIQKIIEKVNINTTKRQSILEKLQETTKNRKAKLTEFELELENIRISDLPEEIKKSKQQDIFNKLDALDIEHQNTRKHLIRFSSKYMNLISAYKDKLLISQLDSIKKSLSNYISFGLQDKNFMPKITKQSNTDAVNIFNEILDLIPTKFIELSSKKEIGIYDCGNDRASQIRGDIKIKTTGYHIYETAIHEFIHRLEYLNNEIVKLESKYYVDRTKNDITEQLNKIPGYDNSNYDSSEKVRKDKWLHAYMGKYYSGGDAFEILSMAIPSILLNDGLWDINTLDPETRQFALGILSGAEIEVK